MNEFDNSKAVELTDEEMEKVVGGWSQNEDGTYNIYEDETFEITGRVFNVLETKLNVTLETFISCEIFVTYENGNLKEHDISLERVGSLLFGHNYFVLNNTNLNN